MKSKYEFYEEYYDYGMYLHDHQNDNIDDLEPEEDVP